MSEKETDYTCIAQQRLLQVIFTLTGNEFDGLPPGVVAKAVNTTASTATHDLMNLVYVGLAEKMDNGNYRLGPKLIQIALAFMRHRDQIARRVDEMNQRYTREPN